jgi:hypothetical protein
MTVVQAALSGLFLPLTEDPEAGYRMTSYSGKKKKTLWTCPVYLDFRDSNITVFCMANVHARTSLVCMYLDPVQSFKVFNPFGQVQMIHWLMRKVADSTWKAMTSVDQNSAAGAEAAVEAAKAAAKVAGEAAVTMAKSLQVLVSEMHPGLVAKSTPQPPPAAERTSSQRQRKPSKKSQESYGSGSGDDGSDADGGRDSDSDSEQQRQKRRPKKAAGAKAAAVTAAGVWERLLQAGQAVIDASAAAQKIEDSNLLNRMPARGDAATNPEDVTVCMSGNAFSCPSSLHGGPTHPCCPLLQ